MLRNKLLPLLKKVLQFIWFLWNLKIYTCILLYDKLCLPTYIFDIRISNVPEYIKLCKKPIKASHKQKYDHKFFVSILKIND